MGDEPIPDCFHKMVADDRAKSERQRLENEERQRQYDREREELRKRAIAERAEQDRQRLQREERQRQDERQREEQRLKEAEEARIRQREEARECAIAQVNEQVGPRYGPDRVSLGTYQVRHKGQGEILAKVKALAARLAESIGAGENLGLYGTVGTGKDHLAISLLRLAAAKHAVSAEYWSADRLEAHLAGESHGLGQRERDIARRLRRDYKDLEAQVVLLSDPIRPSSDLPAWILNKLFNVIDRRYRELKSTWLTVNVRTENELKEKLSPQIFDRLSENCLFLACFWPSFRQEQRPPGKG
jgi:DNA replication protein DnaC